MGSNLPSAARQFWHWMTCLPFGPAEVQRSNVRLHEIDGLRGWAALSVVVFHMFWETFGVLMPPIRNPVTGFFFDGGLALSIFFILSGEALSSAYFNGKGDLAVIKLGVKRYSRLTIPIIAMCVIVFILDRLHLVRCTEAGQIVQRTDWLGSWLTISPSIAHYIEYALFGVYGSVKSADAIDPFLWTMEYEMIGSFVVFGILMSFNYIKYAWMILISVAILLLVKKDISNISCFIFGISFAAMRASGVFARLHSYRQSLFFSYIVIFALACADGVANWTDIGRDHVAIFAIPMVFFVFSNVQLCNFFSNKISRALGTLAFPIYLVQFPIIISFTSGAIIYITKHGGLDYISIMGIGFSSIVLCLVSAYAFTPIESLTQFVGRLLVRFFVLDSPEQNISQA